MKKGQTLKDKDGKEVCLFPLEVMDITQISDPNSYSHCCGAPIDCIGIYDTYPIYAPVSMTLFDVTGDTINNGRFWCSDSPVVTPNGLSYVTMLLLHDNNPPYNSVGNKVSQGQLIGHTGTYGYVTGDHTHIDQSLYYNAPLIFSGLTCSSGNKCYNLQNSTNAFNVFYKNDTVIINDMGLDFKEWKGTPQPPTPTYKKLPLYMYLRRF